MGFRCPNCKEDFGTNKEALEKHFEENEECYYVGGRLMLGRLKGVKNEN